METLRLAGLMIVLASWYVVMRVQTGPRDALVG